VAHRPIRTTGELVNAIEQAVGRGRERQIHPATLTFQALRIAVNGELRSLDDALDGARGLLGGVGSRLAVISFHSLEDRIAKRYMIKESSTCVCPPRTPVCICGTIPRLRVISKRAIRASEAEIARNPRARSARLRVAESVLERVAA
jgi:16S rRNA (cytosine1402-N4)-methyltransferase